MRVSVCAGVCAVLMGAVGCAGRPGPPAVSPSVPAAAQEAAREVPAGEPLSAAFDAILGPAYSQGGPGATAIVVKDGRTIYRKAFGLANVELQVTMRPDHVFGIASLSKHIAAAAILKLEEQGKLSVRDDISMYLPTYPFHGSRITIEHLLTHTSGINPLSETSDLRAAPAQEGRLVDVLPEWVKDLPPVSAPGERWAYSNFGYNLVAAIVEQASGRSFQEFLQKEIFDAAGLTQTYYNDRRRIIPLRATGYDASGADTFNVLGSRSRIFQPVGAGSLLSTVDDLARWNAALTAGHLIGPASLAKMFTAYTLKDGSSTGYGYGWDLGEDEGRRVYEHAGGTTGFVAHMVYMPDDHVFVCVLSNKASAPVPIQATAHRLAAAAAGRPIAEPVAAPVSPEALDRLAGTYRGSDVGTCTVSRDGGRLLATVAGFAKLELIPVGPTTFRSRVVTWTFDFQPATDPSGRAGSVRVHDWKLNDLATRVDDAPAARAVPITMAAERLESLTGDYEVLGGALVTVGRAGDRLEVRQPGLRPVTLVPVSESAFSTPDGAVGFRFVRDAAGRAVGFLRQPTAGSETPARRLGLGRPPVSGLLLISEDEAAALRAALERKDARVSAAVDRWRKAAEGRLKEGPWSVTFTRPTGTTAGPHDFFSEGPYWWPDPANPAGPYVRRDGKVNPDRFTANDRDMGTMSEAVLDLGLAAWLFNEPHFAEHASKILRTWFVDPDTRMNPNLEYGQAIRGVTEGRGIGVIDTVPLIWAAQGIAFLDRSGFWNAADRDAVRGWFRDYLRWLTSSRKGLDEKINGNNHSTWWTAQVAAYAIVAGDESSQAMAWNVYRDYLVPAELRPDGAAPKEEERTKSLSYSAMNLNGLSIICRLADRRGVDLWTYQSPGGSSMLRSVAYLAPFVRNPTAWTKPQIEPYKADQAYFLAVVGMGAGRPDWVDAYRRGSHPSAPWFRLLDLVLQ